MGGSGSGSILTLHEIMVAYEAERRTTPDLTPHDFVVEISFRVVDAVSRFAGRQEREHKAEVTAFVGREDATAYPICDACRGLMAGPVNHSLAPTLGAV